MGAIDQEAREELRALRPDVLRVAAGLAANPEWYREAAKGPGRPLVKLLASDALAIVRAVDTVTGGDA
jgi:hypothetical protein